MKNRKNIFIIIIVITILLISLGTYQYFTNEDENTTLTILEKRWIENNKNNIIDLSIPSDIPIFSYNGKGIFFDFIENLSKDTKLEFNKLSYQYLENANSDYGYKISDSKVDNSVTIYQDNYVLLTKEDKYYSSLNDIPSLVVGVVNDTLEKTNRYLKANNITFKTFETNSLMLEEFNKDETDINAIVVPKNIYFNEVINNDKLFVSYNIEEMTQNYVLQLGKNKNLNTIISKYFKKWYEKNYNTSYNTNFLNNYFTFNKISEKQQADFRSKQYKYGFVKNPPFDLLKGKKIYGINSEIIKDFTLLSNIEVNYVAYENHEELLKAFNENKIDFYFNQFNTKKFDIDYYNQPNVFDEKIVILNHYKNNLIINSLSSLYEQKVKVVNDSLISTQLKQLEINTVTYKNIDKLLNNLNDKDTLIIDFYTYNYYKNDKLKDFKIDYIYNLNTPYNYISRDIKDNSVFNNLFDFYLTYSDTNEKIQKGAHNYDVSVFSKYKEFIFYISASLVGLLLAYIVISKLKKPEKKVTKTVLKDVKLRYIDSLTSLKNRNYLNDNIEKWDNSEVYPQAIVIIDLNNLAYINDNYGHQEGDNVIASASNILIINQKDNSDIIRTDGNEFLIYLVGYEEKEIVSYAKKLEKELKELSHGFGATIGYSIISDGIKTIDDAINEATNQMKDLKEEIGK